MLWWYCWPIVGLTDYEIRDLNDEINKLMREKGHWERQIVTLGGANYRRARTAMLDDEGREVPGTRGYKLVKFGRFTTLVGRISDLTFDPGVGISDERRSCQVSKSFSNVAVSRTSRVSIEDTRILTSAFTRALVQPCKRLKNRHDTRPSRSLGIREQTITEM